eukprot:Skav218225  [mRNA]  locus=scaffold1366:80962:81186:- [translate_table: standard]
MSCLGNVSFAVDGVCLESSLSPRGVSWLDLESSASGPCNPDSSLLSQGLAWVDLALLALAAVSLDSSLLLQSYS